MITWCQWRCQSRSSTRARRPARTRLVDRVAAAAFDSFAEYGIRRSTIDDVARRAGVSKMTVFRRFQNKQGLVEVVIAREIRRGMAELDRVWEREQIARATARASASRSPCNFVRGHPLFDRLLRSEPEFLLPLLTVDGAPALALYRELIGQTAARRGARRPCRRRPTSTRRPRSSPGLRCRSCSPARGRSRSTTTNRCAPSCASRCYRCCDQSISGTRGGDNFFYRCRRCRCSAR